MDRLILASKSPRRQELLHQMGIPFDVVIREVDESYPEGLDPVEVVCYLAEKKARAFEDLSRTKVVLTADTIVVLEGRIIGKPADAGEAHDTLRALSGRSHEVITGCALSYQGRTSSFYETTLVTFRELLPEEIDHYIQVYQPFDKAGAYGIQEWIGAIGITSISGSYHNVVGLPTARVYAALKTFMAIRSLPYIQNHK